MNGAFLTLNAGSSRIKLAVCGSDAASSEPRIRGKVAGIETAPVFSARDAAGGALDAGALVSLNVMYGRNAMIVGFSWLMTHTRDRPLLAVGHQVVHVGQNLTGPTLISSSALQQ